MKTQTLKNLTIILVVLLALIGISLSLPKLRQNISPFAQKFQTIKKNDISQINISDKDKTLKLVKENGKWMVNEKKADQGKIADFLSALFEQKNADQIAQTNKQHKSFELTKDKAIKVEIDNKITILFGKNVLGGTYVRFDDKNPVYLLKNLPSISTDADDWYDKTITKIPESSVTKLTFKKQQKVITIVKNKDGKWNIKGENKELDQTKITSILSALSFLKAQSLPSEEKVNQYPKAPSFTLIVEHDGKTETLDWFKGKNDYMVKRTSDKTVFVVSEFQAKPFLISKSDLS